MKFMSSTIRIISLALVLTACGEKTKTEEWYIAHLEELKTEAKKCKLKTIEESIDDKHCKVVDRAYKTIFSRHEENLPPIKLKF